MTESVITRSAHGSGKGADFRKNLQPLRPFIGKKDMVLLTGVLGAATQVISGCATSPIVTSNPTYSPENTPTTLATKTPITNPIESSIEGPKALDPKVQELFTSQDVEYQVGENGSIQVDLYDTATSEKIVLESFERVDNNDGSNPNILTAKDQEGNTYAYNPEHGWFMVPDIYTNAAEAQDLQKYTEVNEDYFSDGRANIVTALEYSKNPTIAADAVKPHYWINSMWARDGVSYLSLFPSADAGAAQKKWPDLLSPFTSENKPFAWTGFYHVKLGTGESVYVVARTSLNPTENNPNELINLFFGYDQATYEKLASPTLNGGANELTDIVMHNAEIAVGDIVAILRLPTSLPDGRSPSFNPHAAVMNEPSPTVGNLQKPGELVSFFAPEDQARIFAVYANAMKAAETNSYDEANPFIAPLDSLPSELSRYILLAGYSSQ